MLKDFLERIGFKRQTNKTIESTTPQQTAETIQQRMIIFGGIVVFCMIIIIARLFYLQIIENEAYIEKLDNYTRRYETITTPRGEIKDRNGELLVTNKIIKSIIYYPPKFHGSEEKWELAQKFASNFNTDELIVNESDLNDLVLFTNDKEIRKRLSDEENSDIKNGKYSNAEFDVLLKSKITEEDRDALEEADVKAYKVYQQMTKSTSGEMKTIINDASNEEMAYLAEHSLEYPGFESLSNWDRDYLDTYGLRYVIGNVSTETQGLSAETVDYYLARDYFRNERMGRSGLEAYYEDIISGDKTVQDVVYSEDGFANPKEILPGAKGDNLIMATDIELQKQVEEIAKKYINQEKGNPNRKYFDTAYIIVSNPKNGDILASVAVKEDENGELYNDANSNHLDVIIPGSTIKGATVYLGLSEGVVSPYEEIPDTPIKIQSTPEKRSYQNLVSTNSISALAQSSNVYMFNVALRIANANYAFDQPLYGVDEEDFMVFKNNFSRFGLGTKTGVDVPNEVEGYVGKNFLGGFLLDYSMGQYDSYTPMQLSQYINTIANDGVRVKPRYVIRAEDPLTGLTVYENKVEVLSTLDDLDSLRYVQQGFRACVTDGLCRGELNHDRYTVAAKTGTAENTYTTKDGETILTSPHSLLVGYAPYENPEVSITCVTPNSMNDIVQNNICQPIANEVLDYYFNNK